MAPNSISNFPQPNVDISFLLNLFCWISDSSHMHQNKLFSVPFLGVLNLLHPAILCLLFPHVALHNSGNDNSGSKQRGKGF